MWAAKATTPTGMNFVSGIPIDWSAAVDCAEPENGLTFVFRGILWCMVPSEFSKSCSHGSSSRALLDGVVCPWLLRGVEGPAAGEGLKALSI